MPQDAYTLKNVAKELNSVLLGGKVSKILQPLADEIVFIVYNKQNYKLIVSANASLCRVSIESNEKENPLKAFNFCMLLRKHLTNATIKSVELVNFERIIKITFTVKNDFLESKEKCIYAEIMGKYSNIILTENDVILGTLKASSLEESNLRPLLVGAKYILPPPQEKVLPTDEKLADKLEENADKTLGEIIFNNVVGVAKETAKQIEKYAGESEEKIKKIREFLFAEKLTPCYNDKDFYCQNIGIANAENCQSILEAQSKFYESRERKKRFTEKQNKLTSVVKSHEKKLVKRLKIIEQKELSCVDMEENKLFGELLTANLYRLKSGQDFAEVENYYSENCEIIKIPLDRSIGISQNAQKYFKKYNKLKRTREAIIPQKEEVLRELSYVASVLDELTIADNIDYLLEIEKELKVQGFIKAENKRQNKREESIKFLTYIVDGYVIKVGRSNVQNDKLLGETRGENLWLHTKAYHSSHVIIEGQEIPEKVIKISAEICAYYSKGRESEKIEVDYAIKKYVKKIKGGALGLVNYTNYSTIVVSPNRHEEFIKRT